MKFSFATTALRDLYLSGGGSLARKLQSRNVADFLATMDIIRAASGDGDLVRIHGLDFKKRVNESRYSVRMNRKYRIFLTRHTDLDGSYFLVECIFDKNDELK